VSRTAAVPLSKHLSTRDKEFGAAETGMSQVDAVALSASLFASFAAYGLFKTFLMPANPRVPRRPIKRWWSLKHLLLDNEAELIEAGDHYLFFEELAKTFDYAPTTHCISFLQTLLISHPDDLEYVLSSNHKNYPKDEGYNNLARALGQGLVTVLDPEKHSKQRRIVSPAFQPAALRRIANEIVRTHAAEMIRKLRKECSASSSPRMRRLVKDVTMPAALDIVVEAAFHTENWEQLEAIGSRARFIVDNVFSPLYFLPLVARVSPTLKKIDRLRLEVQQFLQQITDKLRKEDNLVQHGTSRAIVDMLLTTNELSMDQILDHSLTFMFAGFETTNTSLQWTLALLAKHQDVQERLYEELAPIMGLDSCPELDDILQCKYLHCVIKESLRMYPVAAIVGRQAASDDIIPRSRTYVRKGQILMCNMHNLHHFEELYGPTAHTFNPDRWFDGTLESKCGTNGYMPFIVGPRNCIGKDFAWNEITVLLSMIVRNFSFEFPCGVEFPKRIRQVTLVPSPYELFFDVRKQ
jgi:cytochrome P450